jgi:hypothetical protein
MRIRLVVLALASILGAGTLAAHPGHDHKMMGTIVSVDGKHLLIKTTDGHERTVALTEVTKILNGKKEGAASDLKPGLRVVVNVGDGEEPLKAKELQYSVAAEKSQ